MSKIDDLDKKVDALTALLKDTPRQVWRFKNPNITEKDAYYFLRDGKVTNPDHPEYPGEVTGEVEGVDVAVLVDAIVDALAARLADDNN